MISSSITSYADLPISTQHPETSIATSPRTLKTENSVATCAKITRLSCEILRPSHSFLYQGISMMRERNVVHLISVQELVSFLFVLLLLSN